MELFYKEFGQGQPLVLLHGLYGSSDNLQGIGKYFSRKYHVFLPDLRNHGQSPHEPGHDYNLMAEDIYEFVLDHGLENIILLGHSMGGKAAMAFERKYASYLQKLIVVDISPRSYIGDEAHINTASLHQSIIQALEEANVEKADSRLDVQNFLVQRIKDERVAQFLIKNLKRNDKGHYFWVLNLPSLAINIKNIFDGIDYGEQNLPFLPHLHYLSGAAILLILTKQTKP
ncbi:MAG: alpha/beta fold hydrolase [Bacteroidales bacterium]|nr:alpha/beta fold hydrolase [Bacteroidales bacterium]